MSKNTIVTLGITGAIVALMLIVFVLGNNSSSPSANTSTAGLQGLQESAAPWQPESNNLAQRVGSLGLPSTGTEAYHQHALLQVYVNGKQIDVPTNIGQYPGGMSSLHTHDTSGTIHMEAGETYPFTLGQFFDVWGVKFVQDQIGSYKNNAEQTVQVYVNGSKIDDPVKYQMKQKDKIVVGYGKSGEVPTTNTGEFPKDL